MPTYSNNLCIGGTAIASSYNGVFVSSNAFDGSTDTFWVSGEVGLELVGNSWVGYQFQNNVDIRQFKYYTYNANLLCNIRSICLQYSDNGSTWATRGTFSDLPSTGAIWVTCTVTATNSQRHKYWRLLANSSPPQPVGWVVKEVTMHSILGLNSASIIGWID